MEQYLTITQINDFIFCPRSLYFNGIFRTSVSTEVYHSVPQKKGSASHSAIDNDTYSTRKNILSGQMVFCEQYGLVGKIDIFDIQSGILVERKYSITEIYQGFRYQLYAQMFALTEMGYVVKELRLYSVSDNKRYFVTLPNKKEIEEFEYVLQEMRDYSLNKPFSRNVNKCKHCVYRTLCDVDDGEEE